MIEKAKLEARDAELKVRIKELEKNNRIITKLEFKNAELKVRVVKLEKNYK